MRVHIYLDIFLQMSTIMDKQFNGRINRQNIFINIES